MRAIRFNFAFIFLFFIAKASSAQSTIAGADASFSYIASTLQLFRNTGRLVNNPGIDGAEEDDKEDDEYSLVAKSKTNLLLN